MARRRQSRISPSAFLQQQGGDEGDQLGMAMEMLGFGKGEGRARGELQLGREALQQKAGQEARGQDIEEKKLAAETERTAKEEAFQNWLKEQTIQGQEEERKYKADVLTGKAQESRDTLNAKLYELTTDPAQKQALLGEMSPEAQRGVLKLQAATQGTAARALLPTLRSAYEKGDVNLIKQLTQDVAPEVLQRPEFEWQKWNQGLGETQAKAAGEDVSGGRGLLGMLWNLPGAARNIKQAAAQGTYKALTGQDVPEAFPRVKYTTPGLPSGVLPAVAALAQNIPGVASLGQAEALKGVEAQRPPLDVSSLLEKISPPGGVGYQVSGDLKLENLMPLVSGVTPGEYQPGAGFPRQTQTPPFEYLEGGPSAMSPDTDMFTRLRALKGMAPTLDWTMNQR